jgi:hypothetical protein
MVRCVVLVGTALTRLQTAKGQAPNSLSYFSEYWPMKALPETKTGRSGCRISSEIQGINGMVHFPRRV